MVSGQQKESWYDFDFKPEKILEGFNTHCCFFNSQESSQFELALRDLNPCAVVFYEPHLDFMRALEVYNAERALSHPTESSGLVEVHIVMLSESSEYYQYMSSVEQEKLGFKRLIEGKEKLFVELKNYKLEQQAAAAHRQ